MTKDERVQAWMEDDYYIRESAVEEVIAWLLLHGGICSVDRHNNRSVDNLQGLPLLYYGIEGRWVLLLRGQLILFN